MIGRQIRVGRRKMQDERPLVPRLTAARSEIRLGAWLTSLTANTERLRAAMEGLPLSMTERENYRCRSWASWESAHQTGGG